MAPGLWAGLATDSVIEAARRLALTDDRDRDCRCSDSRRRSLETRVRPLPWASSDHMTIQSMPPQRLLSPMLTFVTKKLRDGQLASEKDSESEDVASFFCHKKRSAQ